MKIGIDYSAAILKDRTGVGNYCYHLVDALAKIDRDNEYILYPFFYNIFDTEYKAARIPYGENFNIAFQKNILPPNFLRALWFAMMPAAMKEYMLGDAQVIHSTTFCAPRLRSRKKRLVVTIYDLTVLTHPECHTEANIKICTKGINDSLKYADEIIAISEYTKRDLLDHLKLPDDRITVTQLASDDNLKIVSDPEILERVRLKYGLPKKYILFIGSLEPRKNVKTLLKAFASLPEKFKEEYSLVIAGAKGWLNSEIPIIIEKLKIRNKVLFTGYIDKEDISAVYSHATVFVYPSLYEGFGLPILEAMACGTPVITSNTSSMPEVAGQAAITVTPTDSNELAYALERLLDNEGIREDMRIKGLKRAAEFSWERCAKETLDIYKKVINREKRAE